MKARTLRSLFAGLALSGVFLTSLATSQQPPAEKPPAKAADAKDKAPGDPYTLGTCPISGKKLGSMGDPIVKAYDGREIRFCCNGCPGTFEKNKEKSLAKVDEAIVKDQTPFYPVDTSVVSGKKLGAKPVDFVFNNRLIRVADEGEKAEFLKNPAKNLATLDKAVATAQGKDYPLKTCPASSESLGSDSSDFVVANRLIRLCCNSCEADVRKDPAKFIAMVDDARKGTPAKDEKKPEGAPKK